jgi:Zn-finger protein
MRQWNGDPASVMDGPVQQLPSGQNQSSTTTQQQRGRPLESLEDMLLRHEDDIISNILTRTADETRQTTDAMIEKQLQTAWEMDRNVWIQELVGTRRLGGAAE